MIPNANCCFPASSLSRCFDRFRVCDRPVFCIERLDREGQWIQELCFKTEFKAFVSARTKALATLRTYRIVNASWNQVVAVVDAPSTHP